jgi:hypothetical protein
VAGRAAAARLGVDAEGAFLLGLGHERRPKSIFVALFAVRLSDAAGHCGARRRKRSQGVIRIGHGDPPRCSDARRLMVKGR